MSIHADAVEFQMAILEAEVAAGAIERLVNCAKSGEQRTVHVERIAAVVVESAEANGSVVTRTGWPCGLAWVWEMSPGHTCASWLTSLR